jgi:hypothetical protein
MGEKSAEPGMTPTESKVHKIDGVQVFGRKDPDGYFSNVDAIDVDEGKIRDIADRLQRRGYGVMRKFEVRAGKSYYLLKATWAGTGSAPEDPFDAHSSGPASAEKSP